METEGRGLAIVVITRHGAELGSRLHNLLAGSHLYAAARVRSHVAEVGEARIFDCRLGELMRDIFPQYRGLILFVALGAAVRVVAPLIKDKGSDPGVVVVDDLGRFAVSTLSGHVGGANDLAKVVARHLGAQAVITTASDVLETLSPDLIGKDLGWGVENAANLTHVSAALVNGEPVGLFQGAGEGSWFPDDKPLPANVTVFEELGSLADSACSAALIVSDRVLGDEYSALVEKSVLYRPKSLVVGIGCNRGTSAAEIEEAVRSVLGENSLSPACVRNLTTIDVKSDEPGLEDYAGSHGLAVEHFSKDELNAIGSIPNPSPMVNRAVGAPGVCEPAAMLSANADRLLVEKRKLGNVTVAIARVNHDVDGNDDTVGATGPNPSEKDVPLHGTPTLGGPLRSGSPRSECTTSVGASRARDPEQSGDLRVRPGAGPGGRHSDAASPNFGPIFIVGLGPGAREQMTIRARDALISSDVIVGYKTYINLIRDLLDGKEVVSSGMRQEVARARKAIELSESGRSVAVVSSGDAGVYGMAGLVYEVARGAGWESFANVEVVPGVSALNAAAALLGAPLMHDFAVISLSDLLTPWETIVRRIEAAAHGDFVVALYNPKSGRRTRQVEEARSILLAQRGPSTPVGLVTGAYRPSQRVQITDLGHMLDHEIGMLTTILVGNSTTTSFGNTIVTPRGYGAKYELGLTPDEQGEN